MAAGAVVGIGALAAYELVRAGRITAGLGNEDTSIIWFAAREWMRGLAHQPNYYGQSYGSTIEGIPIGLVHALHVSYGVSTAVVLGAIELAGWAMLAWAAWRRSHRVIALLAMAAPVVIGAYHLVYVTIELQAPAPRLLVIAACALLIGLPLRRVALAAAVLLLGVGLQFDSASALLALPVVTWYLLSHPRSRSQLYAIGAGAVAPIALFVYCLLFYRWHPDYAFRIAPTLKPSARTLGGSVRHLGEFFQLYAPELWRSWLVPVVAFVALVALLVVTRRARYVAPAVVAVVLVAYGMSTDRAQPGAALGPLLPRGRILLALPATIWFLCFLAAEARALPRLRAAVGSQALFAVICAGCVASSLVRLVDYGPREGSWHARAIALEREVQYGFQPSSRVMTRCQDELAVARRQRIGLIAYDDQHAAYTCAALAPSRITTLMPRLERRTWLLYDEYHHVRTRMMVANASPQFCALASQRASCSRVGDDAVLTFPAQPPLPLLASLGVPVRNFGPHCHPTVLFGTCRAGEHAASLVRQPFGAPPRNPAAARSAITRAYAAMFDPDRTGALSTVEEGNVLPDVARRLDSNPGTATPVVIDVTFLDSHEAVVHFRVRGHTQTGEAVIQRGAWRVAAPTFCSAAIQELFVRTPNTGPVCSHLTFR
jgi:hypothetical protein